VQYRGVGFLNIDFEKLMEENQNIQQMKNSIKNMKSVDSSMQQIRINTFSMYIQYPQLKFP